MRGQVHRWIPVWLKYVGATFWFWSDTANSSGGIFFDLLARGFEASDVVVFLMSRSSVGSEWLNHLLALVTHRFAAGAREPKLLPLLLDDAQIPALLRTFAPIDLRGGDVGQATIFLAQEVWRHELKRFRPPERGSYARFGVELPSDIASWDDERLFWYIAEVLTPEAWARVHRDYENMSGERDIPLLRSEVERKLEDVARRHGFLSAWQRYQKNRSA